MGPPAMPLAWLAIAIAIAGCVNNYVVGDDGGASSTVADADTTASEGDPPTGAVEDGATVCGDPVCPGPSSTSSGTVGDGGDEGPGDTGLPATGREPCDPCETDLHCGSEFDFCVDLGGPSPVCTARCFEGPPCSGDATCQPVTSVEDQSGNQCVPASGCSDRTATGGSDAM